MCRVFACKQHETPQPRRLGISQHDEYPIYHFCTADIMRRGHHELKTKHTNELTEEQGEQRRSQEKCGSRWWEPVFPLRFYLHCVWF